MLLCWILQSTKEVIVYYFHMKGWGNRGREGGLPSLWSFWLELRDFHTVVLDISSDMLISEGSDLRSRERKRRRGGVWSGEAQTECVSPDQPKERDRKVKFTQFPTPLFMSVCLCVSVCMRAWVCSPGVVRFLDVRGLAALHGNLNSIFALLAEHNLWFLKDTQAHKKSLFTPAGFTAVWLFHLNYLFYLLGGVIEVFLLPLGH